MRATRRATVSTAGVAVLTLGGCTADGSTPPAPSSSTPAATEATTPDPDRVALDRARSLTTSLLDDLAAAAASSDSRDQVDADGRFTALHTAHLAALDRAAGASASADPDGGLPVRIGLRAFRRRETAAQRELAHLAQEAASGALARLLASMAAGIAAHLAVPSGP